MSNAAMKTDACNWEGGVCPFDAGWRKVMMWAFIIPDGLLFAAKLSLMKDASRRISPLHFYHNVANSQSLTMIEVGMAIGCPELVHYGVRKTLAILRATFMADGMFPESTSYMQQVIGQYSSIFGIMAGYTDPPGFVSELDGGRFDDSPAYFR